MGKMSLQMSVKLQKHLTNTTSTLPEKAAETNLIKRGSHQGL